MDNVFDTLGAPENVAPVVAEDKDAAKKAKAAAMKKAFKEVVNTPEFQSKFHTLCDSLEVVNSLGYGDSGNIVVDKAKSTGQERVLATTSAIVGYRVRNIGKTPIEYQTEAWTKGADGQYVSEKTVKVIQPGQTADLSRRYMTALCAQPEFSFQLANGRIVRGSGKAKDELEAYYFSFNKDLNIEINSDEVKLNVGARAADGKHWVVKPEFAETFGYLENVKAKAERTREAGPKYSASDVAANYVMKLMQGGAL